MNLVNSAELTLEPQPASVSRARRWLSERLEQWGLEDLDYDMSVVLSELVTNSVLHAKTSIVIRVSRTATIRLEVSDSSPALPNVRTHGLSNTTGRGLYLVAALANAWGCDENKSGKTVWAEFSESSGRGGDPEGEGELRGAPAARLLERPRGNKRGPRLRQAA